MTASEWLACQDPQLMVDYLRGPETLETIRAGGGSCQVPVFKNRLTSDRKLRFFSVACCRRISHLLDDEHMRKLVEIGRLLGGCEESQNLPLNSPRHALDMAEVSADEVVSDAEHERLSEAAFAFDRPAGYYCACYDEGWGPFDGELVASGTAAYAVHNASGKDIFYGVNGVITQAAQAADYLEKPQLADHESGGSREERAIQCGLLREVVGNPFRPCGLDAVWRTSTVLALAQQMYDTKDFSPAHILADALQDAGCENEDILNHLRSAGPHVRGCWVIDLILGKA